MDASPSKIFYCVCEGRNPACSRCGGKGTVDTAAEAVFIKAESWKKHKQTKKKEKRKKKKEKIQPNNCLASKSKIHKNTYIKSHALALAIKTYNISYSHLTDVQLSILTDAGFQVKPLASGMTSITGKAGAIAARDSKGFLLDLYSANKQTFDGMPVVGVYSDNKPLHIGQVLRECSRTIQIG